MGDDSEPQNTGAYERQQAAQMSQKAADQFNDIIAPDLASQKLDLERYALTGKLTPEQLADTKLALVNVDSRLKEAQMRALQGLQQQATSGFTPEDMLLIEKNRREQEQQSAAQQASILQNMAERGLAGSGAEIQSRLIAGQQAATRQGQNALQIAADSATARRNALAQSGQLGGQMEAQQYGQQANLANARDAIEQMNAKMRYDAQAQNLAQQQRVAEQNVNLSNEQQQYNKALLQQQFQNQLNIANAKAGAYGGYAANMVSSIPRPINQPQSGGGMGGMIKGGIAGAGTGASIGASMGSAGGPAGTATGAGYGAAIGGAAGVLGPALDDFKDGGVAEYKKGGVVPYPTLKKHSVPTSYISKNTLSRLLKFEDGGTLEDFQKRLDAKQQEVDQYKCGGVIHAEDGANTMQWSPAATLDIDAPEFHPATLSQEEDADLMKKDEERRLQEKGVLSDEGSTLDKETQEDLKRARDEQERQDSKPKNIPVKDSAEQSLQKEKSDNLVKALSKASGAADKMFKKPSVPVQADTSPYQGVRLNLPQSSIANIMNNIKYIRGKPIAKMADGGIPESKLGQFRDGTNAVNKYYSNGLPHSQSKVFEGRSPEEVDYLQRIIKSHLDSSKSSDKSPFDLSNMNSFADGGIKLDPIAVNNEVAAARSTHRNLLESESATPEMIEKSRSRLNNAFKNLSIVDPDGFKKLKDIAVKQEEEKKAAEAAAKILSEKPVTLSNNPLLESNLEIERFAKEAAEDSTKYEKPLLRNMAKKGIKGLAAVGALGRLALGPEAAIAEEVLTSPEAGAGSDRVPTLQYKKQEELDKLLASQPEPSKIDLTAPEKDDTLQEVPSNFDAGGIQDGESYVGDRVDAKINSGEMVLNLDQQQRLLELLRGHLRPEEFPKDENIVEPANKEETNLHKKNKELEARLSALEKLARK